jgi:hypothetical protein
MSDWLVYHFRKNIIRTSTDSTEGSNWILKQALYNHKLQFNDRGICFSVATMNFISVSGLYGFRAYLIKVLKYIYIYIYIHTVESVKNEVSNIIYSMLNLDPYALYFYL